MLYQQCLVCKRGVLLMRIQILKFILVPLVIGLLIMLSSHITAIWLVNTIGYLTITN